MSGSGSSLNQINEASLPLDLPGREDVSASDLSFSSRLISASNSTKINLKRNTEYRKFLRSREEDLALVVRSISSLQQSVRWVAKSLLSLRRAVLGLLDTWTVQNDRDDALFLTMSTDQNRRFSVAGFMLVPSPNHTFSVFSWWRCHIVNSTYHDLQKLRI